LFQDNTDANQNVLEILRTEHDYFSTLLKISEKVARQVESLAVDVLSEMVDYRKEWIDKIQKLEIERKNLDTDGTNPAVDGYMKKISNIAGKLVKIDERIYQNLEKRKLEYMEKSAAISGQSFYSGKQAALVKNAASRLNIIQE